MIFAFLSITSVMFTIASLFCGVGAGVMPDKAAPFLLVGFVAGVLASTAGYIAGGL